MAKDIDINVSSAIYKLRREFSSLTQGQANLAIARALNHTIAKARTASGKEIRGTYKIKLSNVNKALKVAKASRTKQTASISVSIKPLPAYAFGARQNKRGVSINVMGQRKTIRSAFIAQGRRGGAGTNEGVATLGTSGHKGVFVRGKYKGTDLTYRTKRIVKKGPDLPIEEVYTSSVFGMITNNKVKAKVAEVIEQSFATRLWHEMNRMR